MKIDSIKWETNKPEFFSFIGQGFDVTKAKQILSNKGSVEIDTLDLENLRDFVKIPGQKNKSVLLCSVVEIDWNRIYNDDSIDLTVPVIVANNKYGGVVVIDGWHRVGKAIINGLTELPCVVLSKKESQEITRN